MDTPSIVKKVKIWNMLCFPFMLKILLMYLKTESLSLVYLYFSNHLLIRFFFRLVTTCTYKRG